MVTFDREGPPHDRAGTTVLQNYLGNMRREELEPDGELLTAAGRLPTVHVLAEPIGGAVEQRETDNRGGPAQEFVQYGVGGAFGGFVQRAGHTQHRSLELVAEAGRDFGNGTDLRLSPLAIESEATGTAEELRGIGYDQHGLHADPETSDLTTALPRHTHPENRLGTFRGDGRPLVRAVEMGVRENDMGRTAGLGGDFVRGVLDELEELSVTVSALGDPPFSISVLRNESGIDGVRLEHTGGLIDHSLEHGGQFGRHRTPILEDDRLPDDTSGTLARAGDDTDAVVVTVVPEAGERF
ncbi:hypothetical protein M1L21_16540 [Streptomyces sp. AS02]|nr:hypothetical protein [Streptomyces sp. AS02]MCL8012756.1 hypothetical protein [Streptomyces sp. AS02]